MDNVWNDRGDRDGDGRRLEIRGVELNVRLPLLEIAVGTEQARIRDKVDFTVRLIDHVHRRPDERGGGKYERHRDKRGQAESDHENRGFNAGDPKWT